MNAAELARRISLFVAADSSAATAPCPPPSFSAALTLPAVAADPFDVLVPVLAPLPRDLLVALGVLS